MANTWITRPRPNPNARLRLFCFPSAGAGASMFRSWPSFLPADIEVCPVQLPGRETRLREPAIAELDPLLEALVGMLLPELDGPFALFGHSMGALIGFELARALRREHGPQPAQLLVSGFRAPHLPDRNPAIHELPEGLFVAALERYGGMASEILSNHDLMQLLIPVLRADMQLCETYRYRAETPLACPITAFCGLGDTLAGSREVEAWCQQTARGFTLHVLPGGHFFIQTAELRAVAIIRNVLASRDEDHLISEPAVL